MSSPVLKQAWYTYLPEYIPDTIKLFVDRNSFNYDSVTICSAAAQAVYYYNGIYNIKVLQIVNSFGESDVNITKGHISDSGCGGWLIILGTGLTEWIFISTKISLMRMESIWFY